MNVHVRKALIDGTASIIFWSIQVAVFVVALLHYWTWQQYFSWLFAYIFLSLPFAPLFGRFLNVYRKRLRYEAKAEKK
jgi:hypothetical protein